MIYSIYMKCPKQAKPKAGEKQEVCLGAYLSKEKNSE